MLIAKTDGIIFKSKSFSKSSESLNKRHFSKKQISQTSSKQKFVWKEKSSATQNKIAILVTPKASCPEKDVRKTKVIEYDYWIDKKTLSFSFVS